MTTDEVTVVDDEGKCIGVWPTSAGAQLWIDFQPNRVRYTIRSVTWRNPDRPDLYLYERNTYARTDKLERLADGTDPLTEADLLVLWHVFVEGSERAGVAPTLVDLGLWLAGHGPFDRPADVVW